MKKVLAVLGIVLVMGLSGCTGDSYEPEVYTPEVDDEIGTEYYPEVIREDFVINTTDDLLAALIELGFTYSLRDWTRNLIPITDETVMTGIFVYQQGEFLGSFDVYEFINQEEFDYFIRRIGNDGVTFGYPRRNFHRWSDGYWFKHDLIIVQPLFQWSERGNATLESLIGEQFAGSNLVGNDIEYGSLFDSNAVSFDIEILENFLSQFITMFDFNPGWKDLETGQIYVRVPYGYGSMLELAEELPDVILGGKKQISDYDRVWNRFILDGSVFNNLGEPLVNAPFIFQSDIPEGLPSIPRGFSTYELIPGTMPLIIIDSVHWTSDTFGFRGRPRLYAYINGEFQHAYTLRTHASFWNDEEGNLLINYFDDYSAIYALYYLRFTNNSIVTELITEFREPDVDIHTQIMIARETLFPIRPLTGLTEYLHNRLRQR